MINITIIGQFKEIDGEGFPSIHDLISEKPVNGKDTVLRHLENAPVIAAASGIMRDEISGELIPSQMLMHCDGDYRWRSDLIHYFKTYNFILPQDFIDHALDWKMTKTQEAWEKEVQERVMEYWGDGK